MPVLQKTDVMMDNYQTWLGVILGAFILIEFGALLLAEYVAWRYGRPRQYIQPRRDPATGCFIGYKWLDYLDGEYFSPVNGMHWRRLKLTADAVPTRHNTNGIYAMKLANDPEIREYNQRGRVLVEVLLWENVIETEAGYRARCAEIVREVQQNV